ncbi:uncharacterized protein LOC123321454 [Coccinella septempunctata]|uniref:uncharacterized protein LOC123321454 n=1 Tax=Coccinella septempunctata TaxID=41139 RepID=UPI001D05F5A7|nr:uncharacterized protein LOC123321454 [Coccinella septempunctata]
MSLNSSRKGSSQSESSTSSSNQGLIIFQGDKIPRTKNELLLLGSTASMLLSRTGTVRRANSFRRDSTKSISNEDIVIKREKIGEHFNTPEKLRRSLDSTHRHSLESISEYKAKHSFSNSSFFQTRTSSSIDSPYSDCTDYATRSSAEVSKPDKNIATPESSYLSWIESVQNEYFGKGCKNADVSDAENKVGEWNNFWLNYQNSRSGFVSSVIYNSVSQYSRDDKIGDELSEPRSSCSTQKDFTDKNFGDTVTLSVEDASEILKCSQRITEIMLGAIKKTDGSREFSRNGSLHSSISHQTSIKDDVLRERSFSYTPNTELQKQKILLKTPNPPQQSTSSSCINAILNTGVADYLKRVINKRRECNDLADDPPKSRHSFSEWSIK